MSRPGWARLYADSCPTVATTPCRCFFAIESALDSAHGPFQLDHRDPSWLGYNEVTLAGVPLRFCPKCGGGCGSWRDAVLDAHALYREARQECDFLVGRLDPLAVATRCGALGAVQQGDPDGITRTWVLAEKHLCIDITWDYDHMCWYGGCSFWPGVDLSHSPFRT